MEGLPRYVELRLYRELARVAGEQTAQQARHALGDDSAEGATGLSSRAMRLFDARVGLLTQLSQRGWGAARRRFSHSGMGLAFLLDEVCPGWHAQLTEGLVPLDLILEQAVGFEGDEGDDELVEAARLRYGYYDRLADERQWVRDIECRRRELVGAALDTPGTRVAVDVSALHDKTSWYDGQSVEWVGESVAVHRQPGVFTYGDGSTFVEFRGVSLVEDKRSRVLHLTVPGPRLVVFGDDEAVPETRNCEFTEGLEIDLGPLRVRARRGTVEHDNGALLITIQA
jgi:hypothetical protein